MLSVPGFFRFLLLTYRSFDVRLCFFFHRFSAAGHLKALEFAETYKFSLTAIAEVCCIFEIIVVLQWCLWFLCTVSNSEGIGYVN